MKKIAVLIVLALVCSFTWAQDVNLENLKGAHIAAMKYHGHSTLLAEKNSMVFMACGDGIASACYGDSLCTAYAEKGEVKIYWYVEKIENGVLITFKVTVKEITYTRSFKFLLTQTEAKFQNLDFAKKEDTRFSVDWNCLINKIPGCIACATNWVCWLGCAGTAAWQCVSWRGEPQEARGFSCPKCDYSFYHYAHYCNNCGSCFSGSSLTCPSCYSQRWSNGKTCSRCGHCYK